jgi:hypothetical protein
MSFDRMEFELQQKEKRERAFREKMNQSSIQKNPIHLPPSLDSTPILSSPPPHNVSLVEAIGWIMRDGGYKSLVRIRQELLGHFPNINLYTEYKNIVNNDQELRDLIRRAGGKQSAEYGYGTSTRSDAERIPAQIPGEPKKSESWWEMLLGCALLLFALFGVISVVYHLVK